MIGLIYSAIDRKLSDTDKLVVKKKKKIRSDAYLPTGNPVC